MRFLTRASFEMTRTIIVIKIRGKKNLPLGITNLKRKTKLGSVGQDNKY